MNTPKLQLARPKNDEEDRTVVTEYDNGEEYTTNTKDLYGIGRRAQIPQHAIAK